MKKHNQIWKKFEKLLNIEFDSKPLYDDNDDDDDDDDDDNNKYIKSKIKIYAGCVVTNFQKKKMPKEKTSCKCLSIITLDSVIKVKEECYPRTLLEEWKYEQKRIKIENLIDDDLEKDESDSDSNNETESDNYKEI